MHQCQLRTRTLSLVELTWALKLATQLLNSKTLCGERDFYAHKNFYAQNNFYSCKLGSLKLYSNVEIPHLTRIGKLNQPRVQHSAIFNGREIMVLGGSWSSDPGPWSDTEEMITEVWDKQFLSSRIIEPFLPGSYRLYPILHMVPYNFPNN